MSLDQTRAQMGDGSLPILTGMRAFLDLAEIWDLSTEEQIQLLGEPGRSTFFKWKKYGIEDDGLPRDTLERISHLLAIFKALQILFPREDIADRWIKRPNTYFDGRSALSEMMLGGVSDIYRVRQFVDAQRG